jgi:hypothetical protein
VFLNGVLFGFKAVSHEWDEIFHDTPVSTGSECPEEGRVGASEIIIFESLQMANWLASSCHWYI